MTRQQRCATELATPLGRVLIIADYHNVTRIVLPGGAVGVDAGQITMMDDQGRKTVPVLEQCCQELGEYFSGRRRVFSVPVQPSGTQFQQQVWYLLTRIPFGRTASYGALAEVLGNRKAARAVGGAAGSNPLPIIIPCHRLIGHNGSLTGFASGLDNKTWLLRHENSSA